MRSSYFFRFQRALLFFSFLFFALDALSLTETPLYNLRRKVFREPFASCFEFRDLVLMVAFLRTIFHAEPTTDEIYCTESRASSSVLVRVGDKFFMVINFYFQTH
jgi:hypothetical protein